MNTNTNTYNVRKSEDGFGYEVFRIDDGSAVSWQITEANAKRVAKRLNNEQLQILSTGWVA